MHSGLTKLDPNGMLLVVRVVVCQKSSSIGGREAPWFTTSRVLYVGEKHRGSSVQSHCRGGGLPMMAEEPKGENGGQGQDANERVFVSLVITPSIRAPYSTIIASD